MFLDQLAELEGYRSESSMDCSGDDIDIYMDAVATLQQCAGYCSDTEECILFVYSQLAAGNTCFLKEKCETTTSSTGMTIYLKCNV